MKRKSQKGRPPKPPEQKVKNIGIKIHRDTYEALLKAKQHPRETIDDVIRRLLGLETPKVN